MNTIYNEYPFIVENGKIRTALMPKVIEQHTGKEPTDTTLSVIKSMIKNTNEVGLNK